MVMTHLGSIDTRFRFSRMAPNLDTLCLWSFFARITTDRPGSHRTSP